MELAAAGPTAKAGTVADAVAFGDVVLIVVPYTAMDQIAKDYGKALATKQLVVDVSNPIARRDGEEFVKKINDAGGAGGDGGAGAIDDLQRPDDRCGGGQLQRLGVVRDQRQRR